MEALLETSIERLLATPPAPLPYIRGAEVRSFVLHRDRGTVLVYNSPGITEAAGAVEDLGAARLLVSHGHEGMYGPPGLDVPVWVGAADSVELASAMPVAGTFTERTMIDGDLEVVPVPGHTPGSTAFLWDSGVHRVLFTGDTVWVRRGRWETVILGESDRAAALASLALLRDLDFDVLVPWAAMRGEPVVAMAAPGEAKQRFDALIARVESGASA